MPNLIAVCGDRRKRQLKLVPMKEQIQTRIVNLFISQERKFKNGCSERSFNQNWKLDDNEIATAVLPPDEDICDILVRSSPASMEPVLNVSQARIKALVVVFKEQHEHRILFQRFIQTQVLQRHRSLFLDGNTFTNMDSDAFRIGEALVCIFEDGLLKFKNLNNLRGFLDTSNLLREATNHELTAFRENSLFDAVNDSYFYELADSVVRQKVRSILDASVLQQWDAQSLQVSAEQAGLSISVQNSKVVLPTDRQQLKDFLKFLNDERYLGPASNRIMITNSCRPINN